MALGQERNTYDVSPAGTYKDPESGAELTVSMESGADALVRMGWQLVTDNKKAVPSVKPVTTADSK